MGFLENQNFLGKTSLVEAWIADGGRPIHDTLTQFFDNASRKVWLKILDRKDTYEPTAGQGLL